MATICNLISIIIMMISIKSVYLRNKFFLPQQVQPVHYNLNLEVNIAKCRGVVSNHCKFHGNVTIFADVTNQTDTIFIHAYRNLIINKAFILKLGHGNVTYDAQAEMALITFNEIIHPGSIALVIEFGGTHRTVSQDTGFLFNYINEENRFEIFTNLDPGGARKVFPCFDEPYFKATFELSVGFDLDLAESGYHVLSNTPISTVQDMKYKRWIKFEKTPYHISTYLFCIVISNHVPSDTKFFTSDFDNKTVPKKFTIWGPAALIKKGYHNNSLILGPIIIEKFTKLFGIGYPFQKMDQISIKNFPAAAMENIGLITYEEDTLFPRGSIDRILHGFTTEIHELAHQWFGNLVTATWWSDTWLTEGMAVLMEHIIVNYADVPGVKFWDLEGRFIVSNLQGALSIDSKPDNPALSQDIWEPSELSDKFGQITYMKGASVLRMWLHHMGVSTFINSLSKYLKKHVLGSVIPDDLMAAFDEGIDNKEHKFDSKTALSSWLYTTGYPVLLVSRKNQTLIISSEQFTLGWKKPVGSTNGSEWYVPITLSSSEHINYDRTKPVMYLNKGDDSVEVPISANNKWYTLNNRATGYYRVCYDAENWKALEDILNSRSERRKIHVYNRAQLIDDAFNLAQVAHTNYINFTTALSIVSTIRYEGNYLPWRSFGQNMGRIISASRRDTELHSALLGFSDFLYRQGMKYLSKQKVEAIIQLLFEEELHNLNGFLEEEGAHKRTSKFHRTLLGTLRHYQNTVPLKNQKIHEDREEIIAYIRKFLKKFEEEE